MLRPHPMSVAQAGLPRRPYQARRDLHPGLTRGVVIAVHYADDLEAHEYTRTPQLYCDVVLARGGALFRVPVLQRGASVTNGALWVPQPARRNLTDGEPLRLGADGDTTSPPTDLESIDGEHVLVDWIDGDIRLPVIVGALPRPNTLRPQAGHTPGDLPDPGQTQTLSATPDGNERWVSHQGTVARLDRVGNARLDTTRAGTANDGETDDAEGQTSGHLDVNLRSGAQKVVRVDGVPKLRLHTTDGEAEIALLDASRGMAREGDAVVVSAATSPTFAAWVANVTVAANLAPEISAALRALGERIDALLGWAALPPPVGSGRPPLLAGDVPDPPVVPAAPLPAVPPTDAVPGAGEAAPPQLVGTIATASSRIRGV